jgi:uncharacterized protein RhaS with RHS repeats
MYDYRARTYDSSLGRFIQKDPIGFAGGINLYNYVQNNPINYKDPSGLSGTSSDCCFTNCWRKCMKSNYGSSFDTALGLSYVGVVSIAQEVYNGVVGVAAADRLKNLKLAGAFTSGNILESMQAAEKGANAAKLLSPLAKIFSILSPASSIISAGATGYVVGASAFCTGMCL